MAKTLTQAGGQTDNGVLPTTQEISQVMKVASTNIRPQQKVDNTGDRLSKDLLGITNAGAKIVQDRNTLSVNAAKRVATDSLLGLSVGIAELEAQRTPDTDLREESDKMEALYQEYGRKTFDNEDAQRAFDNLYRNQSTITIANKKAKLSQLANKQDADKLFNNTTSGIETMLNADIQLDNELLNVSVDVMTAGGYYDKEQAQFAIADRSTTSFNSRASRNIKKVLQAGGFNTSTGFTKNVASNVFNNEFRAYGEMTEDGAIVWNDGIGNKTQEEILRVWSGFEATASKLGGNSIDPFKRLKAATVESTSNASTNYVPSTTQQKQYSEYLSTATSIVNTVPASGTQIDNMNIQLEEMKNNITITGIVERDLGLGNDFTMDGNKAREYMTDGRIINIMDARLGVKKKDKIPAERYKTAAKTFIENHSKAALSMTLDSAESVKAYQAEVTKAIKLENVAGSGITSTVTQKYGDSFKHGKASSFNGINDIQQLIAYNDVTLEWDTNNEITREYNESLKDIINRDITDVQKTQMANITIQRAKNSSAGAKLNTKVRAVIKDTIKKKEEGSEWTVFESTVHPSVDDAIMDDIYLNKKANDSEAYVEHLFDTRSYHYGSNLPFSKKDVNVIMPSGAIGNEKRLDNAIEFLIRESDKATLKTHDTDDIVLMNIYKNGDYIIDIWSNKTNKSLGQVTTQNIYQLAYKNKGQ